MVDNNNNLLGTTPKILANDTSDIAIVKVTVEGHCQSDSREAAENLIQATYAATPSSILGFWAGLEAVEFF